VKASGRAGPIPTRSMAYVPNLPQVRPVLLPPKRGAPPRQVVAQPPVKNLSSIQPVPRATFSTKQVCQVINSPSFPSV